MMQRYGREPLVAGRNVPVGLLPHRGRCLTGISRDLDENLDLFAKNRVTVSLASSDDSSDVSTKLGRLSVGSVKLARSGIDELFSSTEGGKHDYDWLLTPPGTPLLSPSYGSGSQLTQATSRRTSSARSASTTKASRLSVSQSESHPSSRPARSSSVTRSSSTLQHVTYSANRSSIFLNTSSASVSSYTRSSSPITRSQSLARPSTPSSCTASSRSSTPSRIRPTPTTSASIEKARPLQSSRPSSTPSSRAHIPANLGSPVARSTSRPSTPTHRNSVPSLSTIPGPATSTVRSLSNGHNTTPAIRPSSPSPRVRPPPQPIVPPDFPLDTPPNLRTSLPDRPISTGRSRPGAAVTLKGNIESRASLSMPKRPSSPTGTRGRLTESSGKGCVNPKGHQVDASETHNASHGPETTMRKSVKVLTSTTEGTGFGRTISKKSLDMAIRHMDIRMGTGNSIRPLSSPTLFPQSIRSTTSKTQHVAISNSMASVRLNGELQTRKNGVIREHGNHLRRAVENGSEYVGRLTAKLSEMDIYESSRYDAILLKEDVKNTNWLRSGDDDDRSGIEPIFDNDFESLPEPFVLL